MGTYTIWLTRFRIKGRIDADETAAEEKMDKLEQLFDKLAEAARNELKEIDPNYTLEVEV